MHGNRNWSVWWPAGPLDEYVVAPCLETNDHSSQLFSPFAPSFPFFALFLLTNVRLITKLKGKFFAKSTGFVSEDVRTLLEMNCDWDDPDSPLGSKCMDAIDQMEESLGNINMYNVSGCTG